ncbi:MAG: cell wall hydrolase [Peptococcaceae bacterium]|nr:cell wall hydrolase [Peptococcaceae bacterium]
MGWLPWLPGKFINERGLTMSPNYINTIVIRKRHLILLIALVLTGFLTVQVFREHFVGGSTQTMAPFASHRLVVVDAGHGGSDTGVASQSGVLEKDITLAIAGKLSEELTRAGAKVIMTREDDTEFNSPDTNDNTQEELAEWQRRVALANEQGAELFISIHANSSIDTGLRGPQTFVQPGSEKGLNFGCILQEELATRVRETSRLPVEKDHFITKNTAMPAVVVAVGYLSNKAEAELLEDPVYQEKVAEAICAGVIKYFAQNPLSGPEEAGRETTIETFKAKPPGALTP